MSLTRKLVFLALCLAAALGAQPVVFDGGAVNVASFVPAQFPNYGIAQGSLFTIFGEAMGPEELAQTEAFPAPTELGGTSVQVTVGGVTVDCFMIFSIAGRVAAILPSETPLGDGTLTVTYNGMVSNAIMVRVVEHAPGIFTISRNGLGPAVVTDHPLNVPNTVVHSFAPGDVGILWVTGLGARSQDASPQLEDLQGALELTLRIGSKSVTDFIYAGPAPTNAGLDQINFFVPEDVEEGCAVSVVLQVGDAVSNFTLMSISSGGAVCDDDPLALTRAEIEQQQADGSLRVVLAAHDTRFSNGAVVTANPSIDLPGLHQVREETISVQAFDAPFNTENPLVGIAPGSCNVVDQIYENAPPPSPTTPLPGTLELFAQATDPTEMVFTLPANLFLSDNNTEESPAELTFLQGQQWTTDIAIVRPELMQTDEAQVTHMLRMDAEAFAGWDPSGWEAQVVSLLLGDTTQDLTIADLPSTADHLVAGTFTIQNATWRTTISCTTPGDQPFTIPEHTFNSIDCTSNLCNGFGTLNILPRGPATVGTTLGPENSIDKVNGFDRVLINFSFSLPEAAALGK